MSYYLDRTSVIPDQNSSVIKVVERQSKVQCGHGDDESSGNTPKLLGYIQHRFGSIASFTGSYRADEWGLTMRSQGGKLGKEGAITFCITEQQGLRARQN